MLDVLHHHRGHEQHGHSDTRARQTPVFHLQGKQALPVGGANQGPGGLVMTWHTMVPGMSRSAQKTTQKTTPSARRLSA